MFIFYLFRHYISELRRPIAVKICHMITIWVCFTQVQKLGGPPVKNLGAKNMQNLGRLYTDSDFDCEYLHNNSRYPKLESQLIESGFSRVRRNKSGELWSTIQKVWDVSLDPPKSIFFREKIFRPLGGAGPWNFCTR